jgi:formylglycine-generating enzyme required for sulfatase activity
MHKILLFNLLILSFFWGFGNNLSVKNGWVNGNMFGFEVEWNNSWNLSNQGGSYDAVWIFAKGKNQNGFWQHIDLQNQSNWHKASGNLTIDAVSDGKGVFIYSQVEGVFSIPPTPIEIAALSLSNFSEIKIFGIEMVHIPEGEYYLGDGASISSYADLEGNPLLITSEDEIVGSSITINNPNTNFEPQPLAEVIPSAFPKGFGGFYVMKYEVSQIQYVDFLNTIPFVQQQNRTATLPSSPHGTFAMVNPNQSDSLYRNGIVIVSAGISPTTPAVYGINGNNNQTVNDDYDGHHRSANFLSWGDMAAYLDWAALRPITEFEFEKICRGSGNQPVAGEFAWGTSLITNANNPVNDGTIFESVSDIPENQSGLANHGNFVATQGWGLRGVLRTGFAATENSTRIESGAAFYGVMEMSGNVWEFTVMAAADGVHFTGNPGDGKLDEQGFANQVSWCNNSTANGVILKGGGWGSTISEVGSWRDLAVSDRFYSHIKPSQRRNTTGGRGCR